MILNKIKNPNDLKKLSWSELADLTEEIRNKIIAVTAKNGGHLAPNLGVVELTIGILLALNLPADKIIWDVGHQTYTYKLLTGRANQFSTLRQYNGLSGFPKKSESVYDVFDTGHASNSLSVALGLAVARDKLNGKENIVAVIGDGSLTGGIAYEALNQIGHLKPNLIIVLNDNEMSIDNNVGAISCYLNRLRLDPYYNQLRDSMANLIKSIPAIGEKVVSLSETAKTALKQFLVPRMIFEELGLKYIGPIDGHNISVVSKVVNLATRLEGPILIHAVTKKGKGYEPAEKRPEKFHGTSPFNVKTGQPLKVKSRLTYGEVFGQTLLKLAKEDAKIVAVCAAMTEGTGLEHFSRHFRDRFFDVGIAEQHAVTFAAGLALRGLKPVVAIYSTFLQRAYDQIMQDVCLQNLPVTFAIDRAGLVGDDGPTHHGVFDLSYLIHMPGLVVMAPKDEQELQRMLVTAVDFSKPACIRYPRGVGPGSPLLKQPQVIPVGQGEVLKAGRQIAILAVGRQVYTALEVAQHLEKYGLTPTVVNMRFVKPIDTQLILSLLANHELMVTLEENVIIGGFGALISQFVANQRGPRVINFGLPDSFITHGATDLLLKDVGLDSHTISEKILQSCSSYFRVSQPQGQAKNS